MLVTKSGQPKNAAVELLVIDHQTAVFQVKNFHCGKPLVDENENLSALDVALHYGSNDPTERIKAFADRKSTRLNSSHVRISYAVFCLKKKKKYNKDKH